jgi:hypothetical protein
LLRLTYRAIKFSKGIDDKNKITTTDDLVRNQTNLNFTKVLTPEKHKAQL